MKNIHVQSNVCQESHNYKIDDKKRIVKKGRTKIDFKSFSQSVNILNHETQSGFFWKIIFHDIMSQWCFKLNYVHVLIYFYVCPICLKFSINIPISILLILMFGNLIFFSGRPNKLSLNLKSLMQLLILRQRFDYAVIFATLSLRISHAYRLCMFICRVLIYS